MNINKDFVVQYGLLYAAVTIVYALVSYLLGVSFMLNWINVGFALVLPFFIALFIGIKNRAAKGGFISWKESFMDLFVTIAAGMLLSVAFNFVLNTTIDPDLPMKVYDATVEKTMTMMENFGGDEAALDEVSRKLEEQREQTLSNYTPIGFVKTYIGSLFFAALVAAVISLFVKRENPNPFANIED